jgi:hypothetical protein
MPASQLDTVIEEVPASDKGKQPMDADKPAENGGFLSAEQREAIPVLVNGVVVGQAKGAYSLADAEALAKAVRVLLPEDDKKTDENHYTQEQLQSLVVIINAVNVAQSKGAYSLADAEVLCQKVKLLVKSEEPAASEQASPSKV